MGGRETHIREVCDQTQERDFAFSIVVPAYNTRAYLAKCVQSILDQTVGFEEHVQLVLVNDGSIDGTDELCRSFQQQHPGNVVFVDKDNEGVSAARRDGLAYARGRFVNFLDSDDWWSDDALACAQSFLEVHPDLRIVVAPHMFVWEDGRTRMPLEFKFERDRVVDIHERFDFLQMTISNAFVARELFDPRVFDPRLKYAEDMLVINEILLREPRYGIVVQPRYYYLRRDDGSAHAARANDPSWWLDSTELCLRRLFDLSRERYGRVIPYIQNCVMADLQWRLGEDRGTPLSDAQLVEYRQTLSALLSEIEPEIVLAQKDIGRERKLEAVALGQGGTFNEIRTQLRAMNGRVYWDSPQYQRWIYLYDLSDDARVAIDAIVPAANGGLHVEGRLFTAFPSEAVQLDAVGEAAGDAASATAAPAMRCACTLEPNYCITLGNVFERDFYVPYAFGVDVPAETFSFELFVQGQRLSPRLSFGKLSPIQELHGSYAQVGSSIVTSYPPYVNVEVFPATKANLLRREASFEDKLRKERPELAEALAYRRAALAKRALSAGKRIWLISDGADSGGPGAELFSYLHSHPVRGVEAYYACEQGHADLAALKKIGKVVELGSERYRKLFLSAELLVTSSADAKVTDPFGRLRPALADLHDRKLVYLQPEGDLPAPSKLDRYKQRVSLLVAASEEQAQSVRCDAHYGYRPEQVVAAQSSELLAAIQGLDASAGVYVGAGGIQASASGRGMDVGASLQADGSLKRPLFSVVIAAYNTQDYLAQAIESIVGQSIGFEKHIQLILANDGSTDATAVVCQSFQEQFPENIVYLEQKNQGVSAARLAGLALAQGAYVNFLDSDDYWSEDAFQCAADYFAANPGVGVATALHVPFGRADAKPHPLSYKFDRDKTVNILECIDHPQMTINNAFVARDLFDPDYFDERVRYGEDMLVINEILLRSPAYGILKKPVYHYRRREEGSSATDSNTDNRSWWLDSTQLCLTRLYGLSRERYGQAIPYIQYCVMGDVQWRMSGRTEHPLTVEQFARYRATLEGLLEQTEPAIILSQKLMGREKLCYALCMKCHTSFQAMRSELCVVGNRVYWDSPQLGKIYLYNVADDARAFIDVVDPCPEGGVHVEGRLFTMFAQGKVLLDALCADGSTRTACTLGPNERITLSNVFEKDFYVPHVFSADVPADEFYLEIFLDGVVQRVRPTLKCEGWKCGAASTIIKDHECESGTG